MSEEFDMDDLYDSLRYSYKESGEDAVNNYIDAWYGDVKDSELKDAIEKSKEGGLFGNQEYQATQPGFRLLCEKKKPYRDMKDICKIDNIMDEEPIIQPITSTGKIAVSVFLILFGFFVWQTVRPKAAQKKRK